MSPEELTEVLRDWSALNVRLMSMTETETEELLNFERSTKARLRVMLRIYHRFSKLRSAREKAEIGGGSRG